MDEHLSICISDIHSLQCDSQKPICDEVVIGEHKLQLYQSEITFNMTTGGDYEEYKPQEQKVFFDKDGDLIAERRYQRHHIKIDHCIQTTISLVGLQIWSAALLLSDYLIHIRGNLNGKCILELGAGIGICSMISSLFAKKVFCTDVGEEVLSLCERNITNFVTNFKNKFTLGVVEVKELNWVQEGLVCSSEGSKFGWSEIEEESMKNINMFIASDVIYDNTLTTAFIRTVTTLMEKSASSSLLLSIEKRLNFTVDVLGVTSHHYDFFMKEVEYLMSNQSRKWTIRNIGTDFPQYFHYERSRQLELWLLECK